MSIKVLSIWDGCMLHNFATEATKKLIAPSFKENFKSITEWLDNESKDHYTYSQELWEICVQVFWRLVSFFGCPCNQYGATKVGGFDVYEGYTWQYK